MPQEDEPADLRSRAAQAASLLAIVLDLVEQLRPEVLAAMHGDEPGAAQHMCQMLLREALDAAAYDDVSPKDWHARLELLGALSAHLVHLEQLQQYNTRHYLGQDLISGDGAGSSSSSNAVLTPEAVERLWQCGAVEHPRLGPVLLRWLSVVLKPKALKRDADYFGTVSDAAESRAQVLEQLGERLVSSSSPPSSSSLSPPSKTAAAAGGGQDEGLGGRDGVACFLNLFLWVNKDTGCFDDEDDEYVDTSVDISGSLPTFEGGSSLFPDSDDDSDSDSDSDDAATSTSLAPILVKGDSIASFDALITTALDPPDAASVSPAAAGAAARCLLRVGQGLFVATQERHASLFRMQEAATGGLGRYDLLAALQSRILADATAGVAASSGAGGGGICAGAGGEDKNSRDVRRLNHRLQVLAHFLHATASANEQPAHSSRAAANGEMIDITVSLEGTSAATGAKNNNNNKNSAAAAGAQGDGLDRAPVTLRLHGNTTLKEATAVAVEALASDPLLSGGEGSAAGNGGVGIGGGAMPGTFVWKLKPLPPPPPAYALNKTAVAQKSPPPFKVGARTIAETCYAFPL